MQIDLHIYTNSTYFIYYPLDIKGEWIIGDTLDTNGMNNEEYKKKYQQQVQLVRKIWLEEYQKPKKIDIEPTIQTLIQSLKEKERKLKEKDEEMKREAQIFCQQMKQKEKEARAEKKRQIRIYCNHQRALQMKDRELQENQELQQKKDVLIFEKDRELQEKDGELQKKDGELQGKNGELQEKDRELQEKNRELQEKDKELQEKDGELQKKDGELQGKNGELQEKDRELQEKNRELQEKDRELQEKDGELQKKDGELQGKNGELQEKDRELQEKNRELQEKDRELQEKDSELLEKNGELQEKIGELQEKDRELQEKDRELQENQDVLQERDGELRQSQEAVRRYQQQAELTDDHWVINEDEVTLTNEELGRGSYAVVTVGIFRGLRVAVKSLHNIIISDYNLALFSREMSIASQARHPNLVQFIGATKVGNPLILTELMSTSLNDELQRNRLTNQQILSIAQDVALGLNYLHLFKPQPIIHRDVSSPNILLKPCTGPAGYEAKVADYGTAKLQQGTSTGTDMPGNVAYAAPEARDPDQHSPSMDVYSYSVLLMEMSLRCPPEMTTAERVRQSGTVSWSDMRSLIQRGLNANPRARPIMAQVVESLKRM